MLTNRLNRT